MHCLTRKSPPPVDLVKSVGAVTKTEGPILTFEESELPPAGYEHLKALHIDVNCNGKEITKVLVDGGSALNVCPLRTLEKLGLKQSDLKPAPFTVRAYDNSRREVLGLFTATLIAGPVVSDTEFTVMDIPASYELLLGRPWYHPLGAVPSTVHQAIKVPINGKVETIRASSLSKDISSTTLEWHSAPQGFQVAMLTVEQDLNSALPFVNPAVIGMFEKMGFEPGKGLGKTAQGIRRFHMPAIQADNTGLGYGRCDRAITYPGMRERLPGMNGWFVKEQA